MPDDLALMGHNAPPPYDVDTHAALKAKVNEFADGAGAWRDIKKIESEEDATKVRDFIAGAQKVAKLVEAARKSDKKVHDDKAKAVDSAYKALDLVIGRTVDSVRPLLAAFMVEQERKAAADRTRKAEEAAAAQAEADRLAAQAAATNDVVGEVEAEEARKAAAKLAKDADKPVKVGVASFSGAAKSVGLRTIRRAEITNINQVFMHYRDRTEVLELLTRLAQADVRAAGVDTPLADILAKIPGITIHEERTL